MTSLIATLLFSTPPSPPVQRRRRIMDDPIPTALPGHPRSKERGEATRKAIIKTMGLDEWTANEIAQAIGITYRAAYRTMNLMVDEGLLIKQKQDRNGVHLPSLFILPDKLPNSTDKADNHYLKAMGNKPITAKELQKATKKDLTSVQRQLRKMELRGLVKTVGKMPTNGQPGILWMRINA